MKTIKENLPLLTDIIQGLGKHFGSNCEFVIHDYKTDFEHTIVGIVNGEVTNRQLNDCATGIGLKIYKGEVINDGQIDGVFNYLSQTADGRILRSSTIFLHNEEDELIGSLCVNNDITDIRFAMNAISNHLNLNEINNHEDGENNQAVFVGKIDDLLKSFIIDSIEQIGIPVAKMTKKEKIEGIRILRDKGIFKVQKSTDFVAQCYGVSKYTIYNYLSEIELEDNIPKADR